MAKKPDVGVTDSREQLLDVAERLMSANGYAGTAVSVICKEAGVAPTSLYWHFGSKEGLLAGVMERGAARWFDALPRLTDTVFDSESRESVLIEQGAAAVGAYPVFLRLFYLLALEGAGDEVASELVKRVRVRACSYFAEAIAGLLAPTVGQPIAGVAAAELARFAVAFSDGCFFATQLESDEVDLRRMYADLVTALQALAPAAIDRARRTATVFEEE
ncbi:TetR/AcrR family transcriptional regulator [Nocardia sp. NPDC051929]|uniref:TetR/AcrR family transcriptional regulator n=1 Tax=Nocardia sp. NPDC051929 TaxID=3364327 RepID=UPI0037C669DF